MKLTLSAPRPIIESRIDNHLKSKISNHAWLDLFINENVKFDVRNFPYIPDVNSLATLDRFIFSPTTDLNNFPEVEEDSENTKYVDRKSVV